jgi:predicted permease
MVSKQSNLKEFFKIPFLYAAIFGVIAATLPVTVPDEIGKYLSLISQGIDILGKGAIPLLIISLGYSLKKTRLVDLKQGMVGAGLRVFLGPAFAFGLIACFRYLGWAPLDQGYDLNQFAEFRTTEAVIILMGSMPAPITSFLLNEKFDACPEKAASMVLIGTVAGIITIPLILTLSHAYIFGMQ